jgi:hypothetical protein
MLTGPRIRESTPVAIGAPACRWRRAYKNLMKWLGDFTRSLTDGALGGSSTGDKIVTFASSTLVRIVMTHSPDEAELPID